eukprot:tig00000658_g2919.t1
MRLVFVSDTHNRHKDIRIPAGDVLVHCGDWSETGSENEVRDFAAWLREQPFVHKVLIAGNHDATFDQAWSVPSDPAEAIAALRNRPRVVHSNLLPQSAVYLQDGFCDVAGLRFYGSPHCHTRWNNVAFTTKQEPSACSGGLRRLHEALAEGRQPDALLVHGPPAGVLDKSFDGKQCGCRHLRTLLDSGALRPKLVASGHIHEGYGYTQLELPGEEGGTALALNASSCTLDYKPVNAPVVVDWAAGGPRVVEGGRPVAGGRVQLKGPPASTQQEPAP